MTYSSRQVLDSFRYNVSRRCLADRSSRNNSSRQKALPHVAAFVSSTLTASSSIHAPSPKLSAQGKTKNYLFHLKNGKLPTSKSKPNPKTRSSFSRRSCSKIVATRVENDLVVPFIKPTSRPSLYPRIPSPWVSNLCQSCPQLGDMDLHERAIFLPNNGRETGVSVRKCLENKLIEEVADASKSIASLLPPAWRSLVAKSPKGHIVINWSSPTFPRFESPQIEYKFSFVRSDGSLMSVGEFIGQIANIYDFWFRCDFDRLYKNKFSIRADSMRLRELVLVDKKEDLWKVEAIY